MVPSGQRDSIPRALCIRDAQPRVHELRSLAISFCKKKPALLHSQPKPFVFQRRRTICFSTRLARHVETFCEPLVGVVVHLLFSLSRLALALPPHTSAPRQREAARDRRCAWMRWVDAVRRDNALQ